VLQAFVPTFPEYLLNLELASLINTFDGPAMVCSSFFHRYTGCSLELSLTRFALMDLP
jgi:hypothetical protein